MTERKYLTISEASEYLQAKGLEGQTAHMLRTAVSMGKLAAVKDGRSWKTSIVALDAYEAALWGKFAPHQMVAKYSPWLARTDPFYTEAKKPEKAKPKPKRARAPKPQPRVKRKYTPKPKWAIKLTPEQQDAHNALSWEEKHQHWREYLDGKRKHWQL